jgi:diacylglycerol kinase
MSTISEDNITNFLQPFKDEAQKRKLKNNVFSGIFNYSVNSFFDTYFSNDAEFSVKKLLFLFFYFFYLWLLIIIIAILLLILVLLLL